MATALGSPSASVGIGLATGGIAFTVYNMSLPPLTDIRAAEPENLDVDKAERAATWVSAGIVVGIALITQDATVFVIGGTVVVALAWLYRHANQVTPVTGEASAQLTAPGATSDMPISAGYLDVEAISPAA